MSWVKLAGLGLLGYVGYKWYEAKKNPAVTTSSAPGSIATYTVQHGSMCANVLVTESDPSVGAPGRTSIVADGTLAQATTKPVTLSSDGNLALVSLAPPPLNGTYNWPLLGWIPIAQLTPVTS